MAEILLKPGEDGVFHLEMPDIADKVEDPATETAELERVKVIEDMGKFEIANIPIGMAAIGGVTSLVGLEIVDGFLGPVKDGDAVNVSSLLGRGALAWAVESKMAKSWIGTNACHFAAAFIALDTLRQLMPLDTWLHDLLAKIGIGGGSAIKPAPKSKSMREAEAAAAAAGSGGYYDGLYR